MRESLILDVPHRQVVFTIPKMLRISFKYNRSLLSALCLCGKEAILKYLKAVTGKEIVPGIIAVIQSFESRMNFHPHLHFLITEVGVAKNGQSLRISKFNDSLLCPECGGQMSSLTFIEEPKVIDKIPRSPQSDFLCRTTSPTSNCPTGTLDGSRRDRRVLLRPFMTAFCRFERRSLSYS